MSDENDDLSLLETLDHLLDRGVVIAGEAVVSIGDVDLLYLGLNVVYALAAYPAGATCTTASSSTFRRP